MTTLMKPLHIYTSCKFKANFNIVPPLHAWLFQNLFLLCRCFYRSATNVYVFTAFPTHAACSANSTLLYLIVVLMFGDWYKSLPIALWPWGRLSLRQRWIPGSFSGGKGGRCVRLTTLPPSCAVVMKSGNLNFLEPSGPAQACNGPALPFINVWWRWQIVVLHVLSFEQPSFISYHLGPPYR